MHNVAVGIQVRFTAVGIVRLDCFVGPHCTLLHVIVAGHLLVRGRNSLW